MKKKIIISSVITMIVLSSLLLPNIIKEDNKISLNTENLISYTIDGEMAKEKPTKDSGYIANKITCKNNSNIVWDNDNWQVEMNAESLDRCTVDFTKDTAKEGYCVTVTSNDISALDSTSKTTVNGGTVIIYPKGSTIASVTGCNGVVEDNKVIVRNVTENQTCNITIRQKTLAEVIIESESNIVERTDFNDIETTTKLWKTTDYDESGNFSGTSYYYTGNPDNWVSFGKYQSDIYAGCNNSSCSGTQYFLSLSECQSSTNYNINCRKVMSKGSDILWRIIRVNGDSSVRLLYEGNGVNGYLIAYDITNASEIGMQNPGFMLFNIASNDPMYVGWRYGTSGSLESNRTNENKSWVYQVLERWYQKNIVNLGLENYISKTALYCTDRNIGSGSYSTGNVIFTYASGARLTTSNPKPTLECSNVNDQFREGFGLMMADEVAFAGGRYGRSNENAYYYTNSLGESATAGVGWWTMSPLGWGGTSNGNSRLFGVLGTTQPGGLNAIGARASQSAVRPVISINGIYSEGDGSSSNPYKIITD